MGISSSTCKSKVRLSGKTVVITGANTGIGKETARDLYYRGARVILACRTLSKATDAIEDIKQKPPSHPERKQFQGEPGELAACELDLCSFSSVRACAQKLIIQENDIHILINNAGIMMCPKGKTEDGNELQFQTNHLSHFLLTLLLLPKMKNSAPGCRVINLSSMNHAAGFIDFDDINLEKSYTPQKAYDQSKLANVLFINELVRRLEDSNIKGINVYSLHPGVIASNLHRHFDTAFFPGATFLASHLGSYFLKTVEQGAQTTIHCAADEDAGNETGLYYMECKPCQPAPKVKDPKVAAELWELSLKMVKKEGENLMAAF